MFVVAEKEQPPLCDCIGCWGGGTARSMNGHGDGKKEKKKEKKNER
jgi:hypothetical protein